uniref:F-box/LRR-repeat protein 15-like leucin rich repeat domain-containing protein n=1 Tax=Triticum urartu TaxID=4572 RepID=A0A8R7R7T4_TRIUA
MDVPVWRLSAWHLISQSSITPVSAMCGHLLLKACSLLKWVLFHCKCYLHFWLWLLSRDNALVMSRHLSFFLAFRSCASQIHQLWNLNLQLQQISQMLAFSRSIRRCTNLESICLGGFSRVTDTGFRAIIHSCPGLHKLKVTNGSHLTDLVFHDIVATSLCLTHVSLRWCTLLTDAGIERLSFNKGLNVLDLKDCKSLGDEAVRALSCLPRLRKLVLDGTMITNQAMEYLGVGVCPLASLSLRGCYKLTNDCIPLLFAGSVKESLHALDLSRIPSLTDDAIMVIVRTRTPLTELRLRENPEIGDASVKALASMQFEGVTRGSTLQLLDLYDCGGITLLAMKWFKKPLFPRLRWLGLKGSLNRIMVDALVLTRPFLRLACGGEELGTPYRDTSGEWCRHEDDDSEDLEPWHLDGEAVSDAETVNE